MWRPRAIRRSWSTSRKSWGRASELLGLIWRGANVSAWSEGGKGASGGRTPARARAAEAVPSGFAAAWISSPVAVSHRAYVGSPSLRCEVGSETPPPTSSAPREAEVLWKHLPGPSQPPVLENLSLELWVSNPRMCAHPPFLFTCMERGKGGKPRKHVSEDAHRGLCRPLPPDLVLTQSWGCF